MYEFVLSTEAATLIPRVLPLPFHPQPSSPKRDSIVKGASFL
ncbi:hypothetical protein D083_3047 [Dickeya solani RNS 08.23.3.1.A]|nr:hypothetical protein D083_3047 [Dickeya solani RNS 08.23.3.1.A]